MIAPDHVEQIERLMREYFEGDNEAAVAWLTTNFKVSKARDLLTAQRAGQVIRVLKDMHDRRREGGDEDTHEGS
jgi:hypothetical protein